MFQAAAVAEAAAEAKATSVLVAEAATEVLVVETLVAEAAAHQTPHYECRPTRHSRQSHLAVLRDCSRESSSAYSRSHGPRRRWVR